MSYVSKVEKVSCIFSIWLPREHWHSAIIRAGKRSPVQTGGDLPPPSCSDGGGRSSVVTQGPFIPELHLSIHYLRNGTWRFQQRLQGFFFFFHSWIRSLFYFPILHEDQLNFIMLELEAKSVLLVIQAFYFWKCIKTFSRFELFCCWLYCKSCCKKQLCV